MKNQDKNLIKMLKTALQMEEKGYKIYTQTTARTKSPLVKKIFATLSKDEIFHIKAIKKFYNQILKPLVKVNIQDILKQKSKETDKRKIFGLAVKKLEKKILLTKDDHHAYKFALGFETKGYEFYHKALNAAKEEATIKLLTFLTKQENEHYRFLEETYEYLTHPALWFTKEEKPIYEGG